MCSCHRFPGVRAHAGWAQNLGCSLVTMWVTSFHRLSAVKAFWFVSTISKEVIDHTSVPCSKELWDLLANRGGSRGPKQNGKFIQEGLAGGQLQDKRPYILDHNYLNQYKFRLNTRVASELLQDLSAAASAPSSSSERGSKRPAEPDHPPSGKASGKRPPQPQVSSSSLQSLDLSSATGWSIVNFLFNRTALC